MDFLSRARQERTVRVRGREYVLWSCAWESCYEAKLDSGSSPVTAGNLWGITPFGGGVPNLAFLLSFISSLGAQTPVCHMGIRRPDVMVENFLHLLLEINKTGKGLCSGCMHCQYRRCQVQFSLSPVKRVFRSTD